MKFVAALLCLGAVSVCRADPPPRVQASVSPTAAATMQSNQALLNQINQTLTQRNLQHQILTNSVLLQPQLPVFPQVRR